MLDIEEIKEIENKKNKIMQEFSKGVGFGTVKMEVALIELSKAIDKLLIHISRAQPLDFCI